MPEKQIKAVVETHIPLEKFEQYFNTMFELDINKTED